MRLVALGLVAALSAAGIVLTACAVSPPTTPSPTPPLPADMNVWTYCDEHGVRVYVVRRATAPYDTSIALAVSNGSYQNGCPR